MNFQESTTILNACTKKSRNLLNPPHKTEQKQNWKIFNLIDKCFPIASKVDKIFNKSTIKIFYSCLDMHKIVERHKIIKLKQRNKTSAQEQNEWVLIRE